MNIMIRIYLMVCVMLLLFDIIFLFIKNMRHHQLYPRNAGFAQEIQAEYQRYLESGAFSEEFPKRLYKKIKKTKNLITLMSQIKERPEMAPLFQEYIFGVIESYKKKKDIEQAYYTYVISTFDYSKKKIAPEFAGEFLTFLDSKSLYTFINTVNGFYVFGEVHLLMTAVDKIDGRGGFYHKKLLVDGLLSTNVDKKELGEHLISRFDRYTLHTQDSLIDYFRMSGYDAKELCCKLIADPETDRELGFTAMRYFVKYPYEKAKPFFIQWLKASEEDWVRQMISIQALSNYEEPEIVELMKDKITDRNWHIRSNALNYLYRRGMSQEEVYEILAKRDKYTNEALLYRYSADEEMSAFINQTIEQFRQEDEKKQENEKECIKNA